MKGFFYEVREFFTVLLEKSKPRYIGFLRKPSIENDKPSKRTKNQLGFRIRSNGRLEIETVIGVP